MSSEENIPLVTTFISFRFHVFRPQEDIISGQLNSNPGIILMKLNSAKVQNYFHTPIISTTLIRLSQR